MKQRRVSIGRPDDFFPQIGRVAAIDGLEIAVFRTTDGHFYALENKSPHPKGGPLAEGIVSGHYLYDPLYDWKIDLATGEVQAPDQGQVAVYPVHETDGEVFIEL